VRFGCTRRHRLTLFVERAHASSRSPISVSTTPSTSSSPGADFVFITRELRVDADVECGRGFRRRIVASRPIATDGPRREQHLARKSATRLRVASSVFAILV
jgi:hypothetical protein